ncbi:hypothetical protein [Neptunomonas sp.]|uniref:hypothetical protein n=1 Tax=Neptunomonas sp. TaxID=1971898 RepID=UPI003564E77C
MSRTAYLFETRSVQSFIFEGGKLRDMVAASDQLDALCGKPLKDVLETCQLSENENIWFSRKAGGAVYAILSDPAKAEELRSLWSFYVRKHFPGVEIVQVIETAETVPEAIKNALEKMAQQRNILMAQHPVPGPLIRRSPRTAQPVVKWDHSRCEWVDDATRIKREKKQAPASLVPKFIPAGKTFKPEQWPINLEPKEGDFPFINDDRGIALIHADGNGIGELLMVLGKVIETVVSLATEQGKSSDLLYVELFRKFSNAMEAATQAAAKDAMQAVFASIPAEDSTIPARPLVLGGDDLTILIRADLALPFAAEFCTAFAQQTAEKLADLYQTVRDELGRDQVEIEGQTYHINRLKVLTACAGVAFIKSNQPFLQAHQLAESLCKEAKSQSRQAISAADQGTLMPAAIAFHQVSAALIEEVKEIRKHEWSITINKSQKELAMGAYGLDCNLPEFTKLQQLADLFGKEKLNRSGLRQVATLLKEDTDKAQQRYARWRDIEAAKTCTDNKPLLEQYDQLLAAICSLESKHKIPFDSVTGKSPLVDLLLLTYLPTVPNTEGEAA